MHYTTCQVPSSHGCTCASMPAPAYAAAAAADSRSALPPTSELPSYEEAVSAPPSRLIKPHFTGQKSIDEEVKFIPTDEALNARKEAASSLKDLAQETPEPHSSPSSSKVHLTLTTHAVPRRCCNQSAAPYTAFSIASSPILRSTFSKNPAPLFTATRSGTWNNTVYTLQDASSNQVLQICKTRQKCKVAWTFVDGSGEMGRVARQGCKKWIMRIDGRGDGNMEQEWRVRTRGCGMRELEIEGTRGVIARARRETAGGCCGSGGERWEIEIEDVENSEMAVGLLMTVLDRGC